MRIFISWPSPKPWPTQTSPKVMPPQKIPTQIFCKQAEKEEREHEREHGAKGGGKPLNLLEGRNRNRHHNHKSSS